MALAYSKQQSRYEIKPYEAKIFELRGLVSGEAKKLQDVLDQKNFELQEVRLLGERKASLNNQLLKIELKIKEAQEAFSKIIEGEEKYISSSKIELRKEGENLIQARKELNTLNEQIKELQVVSNELRSFITKKGEAREEYLEARKSLIS